MWLNSFFSALIVVVKFTDRRNNAYRPVSCSVCDTMGLQEFLVGRMVWVESSFNPRAHYYHMERKARGICPMPSTEQWIFCDHCLLQESISRFLVMTWKLPVCKKLRVIWLNVTTLIFSIVHRKNLPKSGNNARHARVNAFLDMV